MKDNRVMKWIATISFAFILIPLVMIMMTAFSDSSVIRFPIEGFTFRWFKQCLIHVVYVGFKNQLSLAIVSSVFALLFLYQLCMLYIGRNQMEPVFIELFFIPSLVLNYCWFSII